MPWPNYGQNLKSVRLTGRPQPDDALIGCGSARRAIGRSSHSGLLAAAFLWRLSCELGRGVQLARRSWLRLLGRLREVEAIQALPAALLGSFSRLRLARRCWLRVLGGCAMPWPLLIHYCSGDLPLRWARGLLRSLAITCPLHMRGLAITRAGSAITDPLLRMRSLAITDPLLRSCVDWPLLIHYCAPAGLAITVPFRRACGG